MQILPPHIQSTLRTLEDAGHSAYIVGGSVRDLVMGRTPKDWDITTDATPEVVLGLFPRVIPTGLKHGTVTVLTEGGPVEVTTFRRDGVYTDHRRPDAVSYVSDLHEDLARRDFTVNAMAIDRHGTHIDPHRGREDIAKKRIRAVGDPGTRFREDALRMFRALRFSAQLGFTIDPETAAAIRANSHLAQNLSAERVRDELEKILLSPHPERLADVLSSGLLKAYTPVTTADLTRLQGLPDDRPTRWAAFIVAIDAPAEILTALRLDNKTAHTARAAATLAQTTLPDDDIGRKRLLSQHGAEVVQCAAAVAAILGHPDIRPALQGIINRGDCYALETLAITGDDLSAAGHPPGPELGALLNRLLDHVIQHPAANEKAALLELAKRPKYNT
ncbi:MAG: CCA tRNA nucleotidyltransferase [Oscillospiraceae bacterium]|nr:CCA tRNA nucleotidyltransferase [Oscillospiraceae bacterium]